MPSVPRSLKIRRTLSRALGVRCPSYPVPFVPRTLKNRCTPYPFSCPWSTVPFVLRTRRTRYEGHGSTVLERPFSYEHPCFGVKSSVLRVIQIRLEKKNFDPKISFGSFFDFFKNCSKMAKMHLIRSELACLTIISIFKSALGMQIRSRDTPRFFWNPPPYGRSRQACQSLSK